MVVPAPVSSSVNEQPSADTIRLQERLTELLTRISATIEVIRGWQTSEGDDASIHVHTTTKLVSSVQELMAAIQRVEAVVQSSPEIGRQLESIPVPLDLLELLDHGNGLNPECFERGLLREALGQLAGLKRRKLALEMLSVTVQAGLNKRIAVSADEEARGRKRGREDETTKDKDDEDVKSPPSKKTHKA